MEATWLGCLCKSARVTRQTYAEAMRELDVGKLLRGNVDTHRVTLGP